MHRFSQKPRQRLLLGNVTVRGRKKDVKLLNCRHKDSTQTHGETTFVLLKKGPFLNVSTASADELWHFAWVRSGAAVLATEDCSAGHSVLSKRNLHGSARSLKTFTGASEHVETLLLLHISTCTTAFFFFETPVRKWISVRCFSVAASATSSAVLLLSLFHLSHLHPSVWTMALSAVVFLLALSSLTAATAPDCKDLVKPFMPEDPKLVSCAFF